MSSRRPGRLAAQDACSQTTDLQDQTRSFIWSLHFLRDEGGEVYRSQALIIPEMQQGIVGRIPGPLRWLEVRIHNNQTQCHTNISRLFHEVSWHSSRLVVTTAVDRAWQDVDRGEVSSRLAFAQNVGLVPPLPPVNHAGQAFQAEAEVLGRKRSARGRPCATVSVGL
ncbi:unnamed protein product [Lota lota]